MDEQRRDLRDATSPPDCPYQFTTYLFWHCKNVFREVMGIRGRRREPHTVPLDTPIGDDIAIVDTIPDDSAAEAFSAVEDGIYNAQLRHALDTAIGTLPTHSKPSQRHTLPRPHTDADSRPAGLYVWKYSGTAYAGHAKPTQGQGVCACTGFPV